MTKKFFQFIISLFSDYRGKGSFGGEFYAKSDAKSETSGFMPVFKKTDFSDYFYMKSFKAKTILSALSAAVFIFSASNSYSTSRLDCERHFIKPKKVKLLPPEGIRSLSREETHSLQPKHLFRRSQVEGGLEELKLTAEQFQALNLNDLPPATLASIASRKDVLAMIMMAPEQAQALDLTVMPARIVLALIESHPVFDLTQKFQELDLSYWPQQDLERVRDTPSIARHLSQEQSDFIKRQRSPNREENKKRQEALALRKQKEDMEAVSDHGLFDQAIAEGSFDEELIPFLRISELNDDSIKKLVDILADLSKQENNKELADHVFGHLSNESVRELARRYHPGLGVKWWSIVPFIRDHEALSEAVDNNLFGSDKIREELYDNLNGQRLGRFRDVVTTVGRLRFAELNDEMISKIRRVVFHFPGSQFTKEISKENIAELIRRKGGLAAADDLSTEGRAVLTILFAGDQLADEIVEYAFLERPTFLDYFDEELMGRLPKRALKAAVFGDKGSELYLSTFKAALKTILKTEKTRDGRFFVSLDIDQVESLIRNPHIISRAEFDKVIEETDRQNKELWRDDAESAKRGKSYLNLYIYEHLSGRNAPSDFRDPHLALFTAYLRSFTGESSLQINIPGIPSLVSHSSNF